MKKVNSSQGITKTMNQDTQNNASDTIVEAGPITFDLSYRDILHDQGVSIKVLGKMDGKEAELLRFDCFDQLPHYHYGPSGKNERYDLDKTTGGNSLGWALNQLRTNLVSMLERADAGEVAKEIKPAQLRKGLDKVEYITRTMANERRTTVTHNRGETIIEAGNVRFGLEYRDLGNDGGMAIHVLGDVAGQEIELLAFDCFRNQPHYHYGPRNKNIRLYWDKTAVPDTLAWTLSQFKSGKLGRMIERAGYPGIVAELDEELIKTTMPELESTVIDIVNQNN